jgi:hypothetical protein
VKEGCYAHAGSDETKARVLRSRLHRALHFVPRALRLHLSQYLSRYWGPATQHQQPPWAASPLRTCSWRSLSPWPHQHAAMRPLTQDQHQVAHYHHAGCPRHCPHAAAFGRGGVGAHLASAAGAVQAVACVGDVMVSTTASARFWMRLASPAWERVRERERETERTGSVSTICYRVGSSGVCVCVRGCVCVCGGDGGKWVLPAASALLV